MLHLHEPHAAFHQSPGRQQLLAKLGTVGQMQSVELLRFLGLLPKVDRLGNRLLHPERQFIGRQPRLERLIGRVARLPLGTQPAEQVEPHPAGSGGMLPLGPTEVERIPRIYPQRDGIVGGTEVVPIFLVPVLAIPHRDVLRQVVVQRPQPIVHPRPEVGKIAIVLVSPRVELRLGAMVAVGGPQRPHHRQPINLAGGVWEPVAHLDATLPPFLETDLQGVQRVPLIAISIGHYQALDRQPLGVLHVGERGLGDGLPRVLGEHRLGVEALHVAHPAIHEQPDHAAGLGTGVGPACHFQRRGGAAVRRGIALAQSRQGNARQAPQPRPARHRRKGDGTTIHDSPRSTGERTGTREWVFDVGTRPAARGHDQRRETKSL